MRRRLQIHKQNTRIPTPELSTAPVQGMFQPRSFENPSPTADAHQQPDLKTSLMQAQRYGHHLGQMHDTDVSAPQVAQPKMGMGRSMQSEPTQLASKGVQPSSGGRPLPKNVRQKMESAFSTDFSNVSIHEGAQAAAMGADAYAQGNQIHFQPGKYNPTSQVGQQLLGHELTHVVQQRAGQVAVPQGKGAPINSDPKLEQEADMLGAKAAQGEQVQVAGAGSGIQRQATSRPIQAVASTRSSEQTEEAKRLKQQGIDRKNIFPEGSIRNSMPPEQYGQTRRVQDRMGNTHLQAAGTKIRGEFSGNSGTDIRRTEARMGNAAPRNDQVLHHMSNYNPQTGEGTMVVMDRQEHAASPHMGGSSQSRTAQYGSVEQQIKRFGRPLQEWEKK